MFSRKCVCKLNISKIVSPLLAALSVDGLKVCSYFLAILAVTVLSGFSWRLEHNSFP